MRPQASIDLGMLHQVPPHCHSCKVLSGHCAQARTKLQPVWAQQPQESLQEDQDQDVERCGVVMLPALLTTTCRFIAVPISATEQYLISSSGQTYLTEKLPSPVPGDDPCARVPTSASKSSIRRFVITEKAPTRAFSWLKAATTAFTFKTL